MLCLFKEQKILKTFYNQINAYFMDDQKTNYIHIGYSKDMNNVYIYALVCIANWSLPLLR